MDDERSLRARIVQAVGEDGLERLCDDGLVVTRWEELHRYEHEQEESVERARWLANAAFEAAKTQGVLVDLKPFDGDARNGLRLTLCMPGGDEAAMVLRICEALGWPCNGANSTGQRVERVGAEPHEPAVGDFYTNGAVTKQIASYSPSDDHFQWHDGKRISRTILEGDPMWRHVPTEPA